MPTTTKPAVTIPEAEKAGAEAFVKKLKRTSAEDQRALLAFLNGMNYARVNDAARAAK